MSPLWKNSTNAAGQKNLCTNVHCISQWRSLQEGGVVRYLRMCGRGLMLRTNVLDDSASSHAILDRKLQSIPVAGSERGRE